jgi:hypothetical protein
VRLQRRALRCRELREELNALPPPFPEKVASRAAGDLQRLAMIYPGHLRGGGEKHFEL